MGQHNIKIAEARWKAALAKARSEGRTLTSVIDEALAAYIGEVPVTDPVAVRKPAVPQAAFSDPPVSPLPLPEPEQAAKRYPCCRHCRHGGGPRVHDQPCMKCARQGG